MSTFDSMKDIIKAYPPKCASSVSKPATFACSFASEFAPAGLKTISKEVCSAVLSEPAKSCSVPMYGNAKTTVVE